MYELTRAEIDALLARFDDLIRQCQTIQEQMQRALASAAVLAARRPTAAPKTDRKIPKSLLRTR